MKNVPTADINHSGHPDKVHHKLSMRVSTALVCRVPGKWDYHECWRSQVRFPRTRHSKQNLILFVLFQVYFSVKLLFSFGHLLNIYCHLSCFCFSLLYLGSAGGGGYRNMLWYGSTIILIYSYLQAISYCISSKENQYIMPAAWDCIHHFVHEVGGEFSSEKFYRLISRQIKFLKQPLCFQVACLKKMICVYFRRPD